VEHGSTAISPRLTEAGCSGSSLPPRATRRTGLLGVIVERILEPTTLFYFLITNNGENSVTIVFQIAGGDKQTLSLAPGSSKLYTAPKQFSHPPSFWFSIAQQHAMMIRLIRRSSCQCEFANRRETTVLRSDRVLGIVTK
jgi:hypothetical protein